MRRDEHLIVGRLEEYGRARYPFSRGHDLSYYLKILTNRGERVLWGKDLERAITRSSTNPKVGDLIGARRIGGEAVTARTRRGDIGYRIARESGRLIRRHSWML